MSGNQQPQISMPTWRCRDVNAAIPIKKRKFFVVPEESGGSSPPLEKNTQPNEQGDTRNALDLNSSDDAHVNQKMIAEGSRINIGEPVPSFPSVSVGKDADKPESSGNLVLDQIRVKVEEPNIPVHSSSNIVAGSLHCSLEKLPLCAEQHPGVVVTSDETISKTHDIVSKESLRGECQTEASAGAGNVSLRPSCKPINNLENFSASKGVSAPHVTDSISTSTKSGNLSGVNRSNWDLNTTMDAWEDGLDRKTRVRTTGSFFDSNNTSCPDIETPSCGDTTVIAKHVSEKQKENVEFKSPAVTSTQVNPTCSLNIGISSYPPIKKSPSLSATASEARVDCTSFSRPVMAADNVTSVNLRTVKSEVVEDSAQVFPMGTSVNRVKEEASGSLNPVDSRSIKAKPNNFIPSDAFNRKDGTLNHLHRPMVQSNEILDLLTSFTPNQKDTHTPYPSGISNAPMSMNGMTRLPDFQSYPDSTLKVNSGQSYGHMTNACSGHGDHNLNVSMTEDRILDDCKTSPGTNELSISGEEKVVLSGKELREELYKVEPDCGNDICRVLKKRVVKRNLYEDEKVQRSAAMFADCRGSETEQRDFSVPFDGDNQNSYHVEEKESQAALLGNTGANEGRIVQDGKESGVFILSGGKVDNPEIVDNISPASYKAEISTIDNDPPGESSEGSQSRIKTLDASDSFVPLRMERDRLSDFSLEQRKYLSRGSDESCKFSRERYHGKTMRSSFMPDRRRFSDNTEQDRDTKNFESNSYGNTRRGGGAFMSNSYRGRRPADDESAPFPHSFTRRTHGFSFTQRGSSTKFHGYRDGEKFTRGVQSNETEPMFMNQPRPYQSRNSFARGRTNFSNNYKRDYRGFRSRSRERSAGPSSSFRNRSEEGFSENTDFSYRRSPSGYRMGRVSSPDHSSFPREMVDRRHNSPSYSHRPSNAGRGRGYRGYERGRGYARGRGYGRDGTFFRKPYDRVVHRNWNNVDPRERFVDYSDDFFEGPVHSERFGGDDNVERRQFSHRHDGTSSFRQSFNSDGCGPAYVEDDPDDVRHGQNPDSEMVKEHGIDGKDKPSTKNMEEEEETSKYSEIWQRDELGGDGF